jgi:hypothetical protein
VPTAIDVEAEGLNFRKISKIQQKKIEELTLYLIRQNKKLEAFENELNTLKKKIPQQ